MQSPSVLIATILLTILSLSSGQRLGNTTIDSDGELTLIPGKKFQTICRHTYPEAVAIAKRYTLFGMRWNCTNTEEYSSVYLGGSTIHAVENVILENKATLTIEQVDCDLNKIMCTCRVEAGTRPQNHEERIDASESKTLHINVKLPALNLTLPPPTIYENEEFTVDCSGYSRKQAQSLELYLEYEGTRSSVVKSKSTSSVKDENTCTFAATIRNTFVLTRADHGKKLTCSFQDSSQITSADLNLEFPVAEAKIKFKGITPIVGQTQIIEEGEIYIIRCSSTSDPPPTFDFYFASYNNADKAKLVPTKADYIKRTAKMSHSGRYSCAATNTLSNNQKTTIDSPTFELNVTAATTKEDSGGPVSPITLAAGIGAPIVLCLAILGVFLYVRHRRSQPDEAAYPDDYYDENYQTDDAYQPPPEPSQNENKRPSIAASRGRDDGSCAVTVSISRTGSKARDADSARSKSREADSKRSVRR